MIFAELRGKLGEGYERADARREDLLTSTAFGLLRYLPFDIGFGALLRRARVARTTGIDLTCEPVPEWLRLGTFRALEFWPRLADGKEPDLRFTFGPDPATGNEIVLIEVKLYSGKSSVSAVDEATTVDEDTPASFDSDQLAGYVQRQEAEAPKGDRVSIVYLTAHSVPPRDELHASMRSGLRLAWLSWTDVWRVAEAARQEYLPAEDLADLLHQKGLSEFCGFTRIAAETALGLPLDGVFWRDATVPERHQGPFFNTVGTAEECGWVGAQGAFFKTQAEGRSMTRSEAARQAMDFLRQIHRDVATLVQSVDADADRRGWGSVKKNQISEDLSNGLSPEGWAIKYVTRIYVPRSITETTSVAVAFMVTMDPEYHQDAIAVSLGARLSPAVSRDGLWRDWRDARPLLKYLGANRDGGDIPAPILTTGFSPSAVAGAAFVSPLLDLEDMDIVRKRLLGRAFAAVG